MLQMSFCRELHLRELRLTMWNVCYPFRLMSLLNLSPVCKVELHCQSCLIIYLFKNHSCCVYCVSRWLMLVQCSALRSLVHVLLCLVLWVCSQISCTFLCYNLIYIYEYYSLTLLVGRQIGQPAFKKLGVGLLVVTVSLELSMSYSCSCHHHLHHP